MSRETNIKHILNATKTIAVVGLSSSPHRAGHYVPAYLQEHGYKIIPVNPFLDEALGEKVYASLEDIDSPVDLVLIFQRSENVPPFVDQAIEMGAKSVWLQLGIRHDGSAMKAESAGLAVVQDACMLVEHRRYG